MAVLALPPLDGSLTEPVIFFSATISQRKVEPCGDVYELYLCRRLGLIEDSESEDEDANQQAEEGDEGVDKNKMNEKRKKANKSETLKKMLFKNHYDALGLESLYFEASIDDIRKAYKKKVLTHHPDKFEEEEGGYDEIAKQQWLSIQEAYETLVDPEKKKKYDSTMEFDESIPANKPYDEEEFFREFAACFGRNACFSERKPVPNLGDMKTPINKVLRFYDFWDAFKSWRDFTVEDEYDLDQAENRYERRYMERENKRMKKDLLKKEKARIKRLVDLARSKDPRVVKYEAEETARVEKIREEKRLEKQRRKDEEERLKTEAAERIRAKALKEQEEIKKKEEELRAVKQAKKNRIDDCKALVAKKVDLPEYGPMFLDYFLDGVNDEEYNSIMETLKTELPQEEMRQKFKEFVSAVKERQSPQPQKKSNQGPAPKKFDNFNKWTEEEIALLTKGIIKYPAGLGSRWVKIQEYIGGTKTIHEVTEMAKELSIKNVRGEQNIKNAMEEAINQKNNSAKASEQTPSPTKKAATPVQPQPVPVEPSTPKEPAAPNPADWSQTQQKALEAALKQFPATMDKKDRWTKIAEAVPGKTPKECIDRVKEIKEKLAKKPA